MPDSAVTGGLLTGAGGIVITAITVLASRVTTRSQARMNDGQTALNKANAGQVEVDTAIKAADSIAALAQRCAVLYAQNARQEGVLERLVYSNRLHGEWDRKMAEGFEQMRGALQKVGLGGDIPEAPHPPPLDVVMPPKLPEQAPAP